MKNITKILVALALGTVAFGAMVTDGYARGRARVNVNNGNVVVKVNNPGFRNDVVVRGNVNGFNHGAVVLNANAFGHVHGFGNVNNFHGNDFRVNGLNGVNGFQTLRFNTFGTRTVVDGFGNVFEVDVNGNAVLRGNRGGFNQTGGFIRSFGY